MQRLLLLCLLMALGCAHVRSDDGIVAGAVMHDDAREAPVGSTEPARVEAPPSVDNGTNAWVAAHNRARGAASPSAVPALPSVSWSEDAATQARTWASKCKFEHSASDGFGENLFAATDEPSPEAVVADWVSEAADYDYGSNTCADGKACGHYTQVVWRSSVGVGCAAQACSENSPFSASHASWFLVVCNYVAPGNWVGQKPY